MLGFLGCGALSYELLPGVAFSLGRGGGRLFLLELFSAFARGFTPSPVGLDMLGLTGLGALWNELTLGLSTTPG